MLMWIICMYKKNCYMYRKLKIFIFFMYCSFAKGSERSVIILPLTQQNLRTLQLSLYGVDTVKYFSQSVSSFHSATPQTLIRYEKKLKHIEELSILDPEDYIELMHSFTHYLPYCDSYDYILQLNKLRRDVYETRVTKRMGCSDYKNSIDRHLISCVSLAIQGHQLLKKNLH